MKFVIENGILNSALDAGGNNISNCANLVDTTDARLSDARTPLPGSVVNDSVSDTAGIQQAKLSLDGLIPSDWLGIASTTAARGDLVEYVAKKGQPNGYAGLDSGGKVPVGQMPAGAGLGSVTSVDLLMPVDFSVSGTPITGAGVMTVDWVSMSGPVWFGVPPSTFDIPRFIPDAFPVELIPGLDASIIISGVLDPALLPIAVGLGVGHARGAVPDPGDGSGGALASDYLARDMTYKTIPAFPTSYRPVIPTLTLTATTNLTGPRTVAPSVATTNPSFMFSVTSSTSGFSPLPPEGYVTVDPLGSVWFYASQIGYTDSMIASYTNPNTS